MQFKNLHIQDKDWVIEHSNENEIEEFNKTIQNLNTEYDTLKEEYDGLKSRLDVIVGDQDLTKFINRIKDTMTTTPAPTTVPPTTIVPVTTGEAITTSESTTTVEATTSATTTVAATTTAAAATDELTYWNVSVPELSGMTFLGDTLYAVSDKGTLWTVSLESDNKSTCTQVASITGSPDLEGLTTDGTYLYACVEGDQTVIKIDASTYETTVIGSADAMMKAVADEEGDTYDKDGNGLEAIAYYKDNIVLLGNQDKSAAIGGFNISTGAAAGKADHIGSSNYDITEIADIAIDGENVYVIDSTTGRVIKTTIKFTNSGNYKIENYKSVNIASGNSVKGSTYMDLEFVTTAKAENPEALCVNGDYLYYGCDNTDSPKIYRINKF